MHIFICLSIPPALYVEGYLKNKSHKRILRKYLGPCTVNGILQLCGFLEELTFRQFVGFANSGNKWIAPFVFLDIPIA